MNFQISVDDVISEESESSQGIVGDLLSFTNTTDTQHLHDNTNSPCWCQTFIKTISNSGKILEKLQ